MFLEALGRSAGRFLIGKNGPSADTHTHTHTVCDVRIHFGSSRYRPVCSSSGRQQPDRVRVQSANGACALGCAARAPQGSDAYFRRADGACSGAGPAAGRERGEHLAPSAPRARALLRRALQVLNRARRQADGRAEASTPLGRRSSHSQDEKGAGEPARGPPEDAGARKAETTTTASTSDSRAGTARPIDATTPLRKQRRAPTGLWRFPFLAIATCLI